MYQLATDSFHVEIDLLPDILQEQALEIKNESVKNDFEKLNKTSL